MRLLIAALVGAFVLPVAGFGGIDMVDAAPAGDDEVVAFVVRGVGNGHGRGMSQWGAYGRALDGQGWQEILNTYYGCTVSGLRTDPNLRVRLTGWDGANTLGVISRSGTARWNGCATGYSSIYTLERAANTFDV